MINLIFRLKQPYSIIPRHAFNFSALASENQQLRTRRRSLANLLQLSSSGKPILHYKKVHARFVVLGFQYDVFLANFLLRYFSKSNCLHDARKLFDKMPNRNSITWTTLVSMYVQQGFYEEALVLFLEFRRSCDWKASEHVLASIIRGCTQWGWVGQGCQVHGFVIKTGFEQEVYVGTSLIDFYAKQGDIEEARLIFNGLLVRTNVTWTTIITGYVKAGKSEVSLQLFYQMTEANTLPDKYVTCSVLSACAMLKFIEIGKQLHAYVLRMGIEMDVSVLNALIDFYGKCSKVQAGRRLFDHMVVKNIISWTTMIAGYMKNSYDLEAMKLFFEMAKLSWKPDEFACTSVLTSCGSVEALKHGRQVHAYTIKVNLEYNDFVKNGLIDMYAKCYSLADARRIFDGMSDPSVISYNAMIEGYSRQQKLCEAIDLFCSMRHRLSKPGLLTYVSLLGVSAALFNLKLSQQIHCLISKCGFSLDIFASSALIDVYSKCAYIRDARLVFEEMNEKDIVVWNAMFFGYVQRSESEEALKLYFDLQLSGQNPDDFTFVALLTATSVLASLRHGQKLHNQVIKVGLDFDSFITSSLVDMYAKCGSIEEACKTFSYTSWRDVVCWNSMISTYAHHGEAKKALQIFERMINEGIEPNYITFVGVLSACSHGGLVEDGLGYFESMPQFGIEPGTDHYACIVSLLGRAGKLLEAKEFIEKMSIKPAAVVWRSLLSACRVAGNIELGEYAAEKAFSSNPVDSGSYILLSNIFASKGMWVDVRRVRQKMDFSGVVKEAGQSWIELNNEVHTFVARDTCHTESDTIFSVLDSLMLEMKGVGYVPNNKIPLVND
ncbi:pentatricopeptide repeat-containing protein At4g39530 [Humulus lupulus]|uniref:pentatricopeptide repeat-containing protein At4g39530 n=1 Tax=Humulus lupulus TaxID=3486 RepID=UPI002B412F72|nr:pentatricopeptide repeat-containing protein At4g39530 [Humulus lupulus]XP_062098006.1 pentatricopeptide repeat-containing protein At4g39530 [Humulus lupulus]